jgi:hypothetical protein
MRGGDLNAHSPPCVCVCATTQGKVLYAGTPQDARPFFVKLRAPAYPAQNLSEFSQEYLSTVSQKDVQVRFAATGRVRIQVH